MDPLISIIVPVYNVAPYLAECVNSLLTQTYKMLEIILVNDGSTDGSGAICDEYATRDKRVCVIHQENQGLSAARNKGIEAANGAYIGFVDSDDWVAPQMYKRLYDALVAAKADVIICGYCRLRDGEAYAEPISGKAQILSRYEALGNGFGPQGESYNLTWNKLYSRDTIGDVRFPVNKINEDDFTTYRYLHRAEKIVVITDELYYYRIREGSITQSDRYLADRDTYEALEARLALYEAEGWTDHARKVKKLTLDRHIDRYIKGWRNKKRDWSAWRRHITFYRSYYNRYKADVPGFKYKAFTISPVLYAVLSRVKGRINNMKK